MTTIPQKDKERIFALYWGQKVLVFNDKGQYKPGVTYNVQGDFDDTIFLELSPLSSISNEDMNQVLSLQEYLSKPPHFKPWFDISTNNLSLCMQSYISESSESVYSSTIDFLRSKGYALPAYGYTVEQLVDAGVFKLK